MASDNHQIQVFWREESGHVVRCAHTGDWNPPTVIKEIGPGFQITVLEWEAGQRLRLYAEDYKNFLYEFCSDDGGETWFPGQDLSGK